MDTAGRLLRLLTLLSSRPWWTGAELVDRLEITDRTLRRDITRLRQLGYPVEATTGPYGGYRLGAAGRLPPLLLDDDEAVAVAVALRAASEGTASGLETAALSALTKLDQVLPVGLRERVGALRTVTIGLRRAELPPVDLDVLVVAAVACRRPERLRFRYTNADGAGSDRRVEPFRLVYTERRWYLVAYDLDRQDWRTFRVDRVGPPVATGAKGVAREAPDAAALVAEGVAVRAYDVQARVRFPVPREVLEQHIAPTVGVIEQGRAGARTSTAVIGGDIDWIARYLASMPFPFDVLEPPAVRDEVAALARQLLAYVAAPAAP
jgi:predicted DNA-binding transcriptional regulator YafY